MPSVVKHAWTHLTDGSDPLPVGGFTPTWATVGRGSASVSPTDGGGLGSFYRPRLRFLTTDDTDTFEMVGLSSGLADYIQINNDGYYHCWFDISLSTATQWPAFYVALQPLIEVGAADVQLDSQVGGGDWMPQSSPIWEQLVEEQAFGPPSHRGLWSFAALDYRAGVTLNTPLKLACRVIVDEDETLLSAINLIVNIHIMRLTDGATNAVTEIDADDLS